MKIEINFEGLNKILCKLGLHRWWKGEYKSDLLGYGVFKMCLDCQWEVRV